MTEPKWIEIARKDIGIKEIPGAKHNSIIMGWLKKLKSWIVTDEDPWCGTFCAHCMQEAGYAYPAKYYRALEWLTWGEHLQQPMVGCVAVFTRTGGGHVGFVVGKDSSGRILVLGGNQGNQVCITPFETSRVAGYRFPSRYPFTMHPLPVIESNALSSSNES